MTILESILAIIGALVVALFVLFVLVSSVTEAIDWRQDKRRQAEWERDAARRRERDERSIYIDALERIGSGFGNPACRSSQMALVARNALERGQNTEPHSP